MLVSFGGRIDDSPVTSLRPSGVKNMLLFWSRTQPVFASAYSWLSNSSTETFTLAGAFLLAAVLLMQARFNEYLLSPVLLVSVVAVNASISSASLNAGLPYASCLQERVSVFNFPPSCQPSCIEFAVRLSLSSFLVVNAISSPLSLNLNLSTFSSVSARFVAGFRMMSPDFFFGSGFFALAVSLAPSAPLASAALMPSDSVAFSSQVDL